MEPKFAERSIVKHSEYLKKSRVVMSAAKSVSASEVVTESGEHVPYDYLIISTGSTYTGPSTKNERVQLYEAGKWRMPSHFVYSNEYVDDFLGCLHDLLGFRGDTAQRQRTSVSPIKPEEHCLHFFFPNVFHQQTCHSSC